MVFDGEPRIMRLERGDLAFELLHSPPRIGEDTGANAARALGLPTKGASC